MNAYPIQVMLIDTIHAPGGVVELGVLATDFLDGPPQRFNICDVSWDRSDEAFEAAASPDPWARHEFANVPPPRSLRDSSVISTTSSPIPMRRGDWRSSPSLSSSGGVDHERHLGREDRDRPGM